MPLVMLIGLAIESVVVASLLMREDESIAKIVPVPKAEEFLKPMLFQMYVPPV